MLDSLVGYLKENGLGLIGGTLASVATGNPAPLIAKIAGSLGVDPTPEAIEEKLKADPQALLTLKKMESDERLELERLSTENRKIEHQNTESARELYKHDNASQKNLIKHAQVQFYFMTILGAASFLVIASFVEDKGLAMAASAFIASGMTLVTNRLMTIDNFFFGSSQGSRIKDKKDNE